MFQYQLANLFAHSLFYLFGYLVLFLFLRVSEQAFFSIQFSEGPFFVMLFLGVLASVSFAQFLVLFFPDPKIAVGVFMIMMAEYSFLLFKTSFVTGFFLPNMFFCFAISQQITNSLHSRNIHYDSDISEPF